MVGDGDTHTTMVVDTMAHVIDGTFKHNVYCAIDNWVNEWMDDFTSIKTHPTLPKFMHDLEMGNVYVGDHCPSFASKLDTQTMHDVMHALICAIDDMVDIQMDNDDVESIYDLTSFMISLNENHVYIAPF